jgi:hypothetical protein
MKQKIQSISIKNPCHENWDNMTDIADGKFCNSCQKNIVDFTELSNEEIVDWISSPVRICAKVDKEKLKDLNNYIAQCNNHPFPWKKFLAASLIGILPIVKTEAKPNNALIEQTTSSYKINNQAIRSDTVKKITLSGRVISNKDSSSIAGATVKVKGRHIGTSTDRNGNFELIVPDTTQMLVIICYNCVTRVIKIKPGTIEPYNISMEINPSALIGEVMVTRKLNFFERIWWRVKRIF